MKPPQIETVFAIALGQVDPLVCSEYIGLQPDRVSYPKAAGFSPAWEISRTREPLYSIDEGLAEVIEIIWPSRELIVAFCNEKRCHCSLLSNVKTGLDGEARPVFELSAKTISALSTLRADWLMDLYWCGPDTWVTD